jgi:predicted Rossmann fold flavoprotein
MPNKYDLVIIGGGAAGICAAISKARQGGSVVICEKTMQIGKKILATGDGRCNLLNENLDESFYNPEAQNLVRSIFSKFGKTEILNFFKGLGLETYSKDGRIFPFTNQAASVLKVLEMELKRLSVPIEFEFDCSGITFSDNEIIVLSKAGKSIKCHQIVITGGGKTYPAFGSDGSTYEIGRQLGHTIVEPIPSTVPLVVKDNLCPQLQGQRISAKVKSVIEGEPGEAKMGELLFTKYGLSGTCILDVSEEISIAINRYRKKDVFVSVDMVPFMEQKQLKDELNRRKKNKIRPEDLITGILPNKFNSVMKTIFDDSNTETITNILKGRMFRVTATRGWNEAEFTNGGIAVNEVFNGTLKSKLKDNMYFAGEVMDVNGKRGGYNLAWAWSSGFVAGQTK